MVRHHTAGALRCMAMLRHMLPVIISLLVCCEGVLKFQVLSYVELSPSALGSMFENLDIPWLPATGSASRQSLDQ